jgi:hypothetical protein
MSKKPVLMLLFSFVLLVGCPVTDDDTGGNDDVADDDTGDDDIADDDTADDDTGDDDSGPLPISPRLGLFARLDQRQLD